MNVDASDSRYVRRQYRTRDNLATRVRTHQLYDENPVDFINWVLDKIAWTGDERVVDVGCGAGSYIEPVRQRTPNVIAGDLSHGMLRALDVAGVPRLNMDAQRLPLRDRSVDVVLANHMIYHVPDQYQAVREFSRVLRPGGRLVAATNSAHTMSELYDLAAQLSSALSVPQPLPIRPRLAFTLENGEPLLSRFFTKVERHDLPGALVFPEPQPVIAYLASARERYEAMIPSPLTWDDLAKAAGEILARHIAEHGTFRVNKLTGVFVCHNT